MVQAEALPDDVPQGVAPFLLQPWLLGGLVGTVLTAFKPGSWPCCTLPEILPQAAEALREQKRKLGSAHHLHCSSPAGFASRRGGLWAS